MKPMPKNVIPNEYSIWRVFKIFWMQDHKPEANKTTAGEKILSQPCMAHFF